MLFDNWYSLFRIAVMATVGYAVLVTVLRLAGKRTLSKMNAFDLVITVALGSMFATIILSKDVSLADGVMAISMLGLLQYLASWFSVRFPAVENLLKAQPTLVVYQQQYLKDVMRRVRLTESEVVTALRQSGTRLSDVEAVVLETDGSVTVVPVEKDKSADEILQGVEPAPENVRMIKRN
jgi:uncharacterized membrane protein YcaP (DUF421 family)